MSGVPHINGAVSRRISRAVNLLEDPEAVHSASEPELQHAETIATLGAIIQGVNHLAEIAENSEKRLEHIEDLAQDSNTQLHNLRSNPFISFWRKNPRAMLLSVGAIGGSVTGLVTRLLDLWG